MISTNNESTLKLNTISDAIEDIKKGKVVIVVDDENRTESHWLPRGSRRFTFPLLNHIPNSALEEARPPFTFLPSMPMY